MIKSIHTIGLLCPRGFKFYSYEVVAGMVDYAAPHPGLRFKDFRFRDLAEVKARIRNASCAGLILGLKEREYRSIKRHLPAGIPICNVHPDVLAPDIPTLSLDLASLATKAVGYFRGLGFKHFGLLSATGTSAQDELFDILGHLCLDNGMDCARQHVKLAPSIYSTSEQSPPAELKAWVSKLPKPVAVLTSGGYSALLLSKTATELKITIPDELAILSESDEEICLFAGLPISSIRSAGPRIGREALRLIHEALSGTPLPRGRITFPVSSIIERGSTGFPSGMDPSVKNAIHFIRRTTGKGIGISDILDEVPGLSRARLYRQFRRFLDRAPAEEILRVQIDKAKELLVYAPMTIAEITEECGFASQAAFSRTFRRMERCAPSEWRRTHMNRTGDWTGK